MASVENSASARGPAAEEIRHQLRSVLASPSFQGSKRCQRFLEYVCEKSLEGDIQALKERVIATEVFGRPPESDLGEDTIVRVGAREVRKRLAQYYVSEEGAASQVRINLPPGSYAPEFRAAKVEQKEAAAGGNRKAAGWGRLRAGALSAAAIGLAAVGTWGVLRDAGGTGQREATEFWRPVMQAQGPLLVAVAHPLVYHASIRAMKLSQARHPEWAPAEQRAVALDPKEMDGSDMVPVRNQYVGFGDLVAVTDVALLLAKQHKDVRVRMASEIEFADLRQTPALLVGAITNKWTMQMQQSWRFQFQRTPEFTNLIEDTYSTGAKRRQWRIPSNDDGSSPEDFMLVCRVQSPFTGAPLLLVAGLKQFGTEAAGALISDPERLGAILRRLPAGWETKNLQLVLHSRVIGNSAAQPELVAWHAWPAAGVLPGKK